MLSTFQRSKDKCSTLSINEVFVISFYIVPVASIAWHPLAELQVPKPLLQFFLSSVAAILFFFFFMTAIKASPIYLNQDVQQIIVPKILVGKILMRQPEHSSKLSTGIWEVAALTDKWLWVRTAVWRWWMLYDMAMHVKRVVSSNCATFWNDSALGLWGFGKCLGTKGTMERAIFLLFSTLAFQDRLCCTDAFLHGWAWISPLQTVDMVFICIVTTKTEQGSIRGGQIGCVYKYWL